MSLDYHPELRRQHEAHRQARARIERAARPEPKPAITVSVDKPVENVEKQTVFSERDWLVVTEPSGVREITKEVCKQFGIRRMEFEARRRTAEIVLPRQIAMALSKHLTLKSLPEIGRMIGRRDHTTVLYACRKLQPVIDAVALRLSNEDSISDWVKAVRAQVLITPCAANRNYRRKAV